MPHDALCPPITLPHLLKGRLRLPPAKIRQRPGCVSQHGQLIAILKLVQQWLQCACPQHLVPALGGVPCDVAQCPHCLQRRWGQRLRISHSENIWQSIAFTE